MHDMQIKVIIICFTIFAIIAPCVEYHRFKSIQKRFPGMGYLEFLLTESKIRITP